jgi:plasmid stabilization system protein ParE
MTLVRLLREAEEELRVAAQSYEKAQSGLGQAFVDQVRRSISLIAEYPRAARVERGEIRIRSVARFPYRIYYRVRPDEVVIVAVGHRRRRPGFWRSREESYSGT